MGIVSDLFSGGLMKSVESIATEWIETDIEKAEAQAVMIKALDPNGKLRRVVTQFTCIGYGFYLLNMVVLSYMVAFGIGDSVGAEQAAGMLVDLFLPITTAFGTIVTASFGVNGVNSYKGK